MHLRHAAPWRLHVARVESPSEILPPLLRIDGTSPKRSGQTAGKGVANFVGLQESAGPASGLGGSC